MNEVTVSVRASGTSILDVLETLYQETGEGFRGTLDQWARDVAFPYIRDNWPRPEWAPLAASTLEEKRRKGYPDTPLVRTGALLEAATQPGAPGNILEVEPYSVTLGVSGDVIPYASLQHDGGGNVPARPWDMLTGEPLEVLEKMIMTELQRTMEGWTHAHTA